jgi:hypothetical protein
MKPRSRATLSSNSYPSWRIRLQQSSEEQKEPDWWKTQFGPIPKMIVPNSFIQVQPPASVEARNRPLLKLAPGRRTNLSSVAIISRTQSPHAGRQTEHGILETPNQVKVWLKFETFPIWLLALDSHLVSQLCLIGFSSRSPLASRISEICANIDQMDAALNNVGASEIIFSTDETPPNNTVYLVSGSRTFVNKWHQKGVNPMLVLCEEHAWSKHMETKN